MSLITNCCCLFVLCPCTAHPLVQAEALQLLAHLFKPALSLQERRTARQRKLDKLKAAQEQQQQQQKGGKAKSGKAMAAAGAEAEKEEGLGADNEALAASLSKERQPLGAALVCAVAGAGMKRHYHVLALKSAATVVEGLRVLFPNK